MTARRGSESDVHEIGEWVMRFGEGLFELKPSGREMID
jgi:hypothetical protein